MKYIYLNDDSTVREIISEINPAFPNVPISERYTPAFVEKLMPVEDVVEAEQNWIYDPETYTFSPPPQPELEPPPEEPEGE